MYTAMRGLKELGVDVGLEYLGNLRSPVQIIQARKKIRKLAFEFDLVHAQYGSACALVTAAVKNRPIVVTIRGNDWTTHDVTFGFSYVHTRLARLMTLISLPRFAGVVSVSKRMQKSLMPYAEHSKFIVLPAPIDLEKWSQLKPEVKSRKEKYVLFTNQRLSDPIKRYDLCEKVIELANRSMNNIVLRIASDLPYEAMPEFVASCDAILCTSESEGWPNSIKEALACNVPFVSTDVSDLSEIADNEPSCRVCADNAEELANNLCEVLKMPRPDNLRRFVEPMDIKSSSKRLLSFYESLIKKK